MSATFGWRFCFYALVFNSDSINPPTPFCAGHDETGQESAMNSGQELSLCNFIETGLSAIYETTPDLTDGMCILGLDNSVIALKHHFGFARNETVLSRPGIDDIVEHVVDVGIRATDEVNDVTLKDFIGVINKIKKSVIRHSAFGPRAYYDFIKNYV
jgi:hypothetical protein